MHSQIVAAQASLFRGKYRLRPEQLPQINKSITAAQADLFPSANALSVLFQKT
jgi:hypothetical protein